MSWVDVVEYERLPSDRGAAALVDGRAVAVFRLADGSVYAIDHVEPFTGVPVLARGLVGSQDGVPTVASPLHKQRFDLRSGSCLDADASGSTYAVTATDGVVRVATAPSALPDTTTTATTATVPSSSDRQEFRMTPAQIDLVQTSFTAVEPIAETAAELFYGRLFEIAPDTAPLFTGDMTAQGRKLMTTLGIVVRGLEGLDDLMPTIVALAERHVGYGVTAAHYEAVGAALLWTLERGLGEAYTPDVAEAWTTTYGVLSDAMTTAAYGTATDSQLAS